MILPTKHDCILSYATASLSVTAGAWWFVGPIGLLAGLVVTLGPALLVAVVLGVLKLMTKQVKL